MTVAVVDKLLSMRLATIVLNVRKSNAGAIHDYERVGFRMIAALSKPRWPSGTYPLRDSALQAFEPGTNEEVKLLRSRIKRNHFPRME